MKRRLSSLTYHIGNYEFVSEHESLKRNGRGSESGATRKEAEASPQYLLHRRPRGSVPAHEFLRLLNAKDRSWVLRGRLQGEPVAV